MPVCCCPSRTRGPFLSFLAPPPTHTPLPLTCATDFAHTRTCPQINAQALVRPSRGGGELKARVLGSTIPIRKTKWRADWRWMSVVVVMREMCITVSKHSSARIHMRTVTNAAWCASPRPTAFKRDHAMSLLGPISLCARSSALSRFSMREAEGRLYRNPPSPPPPSPLRQHARWRGHVRAVVVHRSAAHLLL